MLFTRGGSFVPSPQMDFYLAPRFGLPDAQFALEDAKERGAARDLRSSPSAEPLDFHQETGEPLWAQDVGGGGAQVVALPGFGMPWRLIAPALGLPMAPTAAPAAQPSPSSSSSPPQPRHEYGGHFFFESDRLLVVSAPVAQLGSRVLDNLLVTLLLQVSSRTKKGMG